MGESVADLYFLTNAKPAAEDMARRLGQTAVPALYSWRPEEIEAVCEKIMSALDIRPEQKDGGVSLKSILAGARRRAEAALAHLRETLGDMPVAIDATATPRPLSLARLLLEHGIKVYAVYMDAGDPVEEEDFHYLAEHFPDLLYRAMEHYKMRLLPRDDEQRIGPVLAIGQKAAYFTGCSRFVNLEENGGEFRFTENGAEVVGCAEAAAGFSSPDPDVHQVELYGFEGIVKLAAMMEYAAAHPADVSKVIQVKAWGCRGDAQERAALLSRAVCRTQPASVDAGAESPVSDASLRGGQTGGNCDET